MEKWSDSAALPQVVENLQNKKEREEETDGDGGNRIRIHVGGLGGSVTEDDLHRMFGGGGTVKGVEIVRTKGRSFAYVDLLPSSDKSLSKLFTTYNGCAWKGGKLRLHKAKEHYLVRLKREWAEDAADTKPSSGQKEQPSNTKQLRVFFPALRTVKAVPFTGTGKHKYSFQRVEVPSLPVNFCDCEEHSRPPAATFVAHVNHQNPLCDDGINEQELDVMKKVMDKLFQSQKNASETTRDQSRTARLPNQQHQLHVATAAADDDDLIIDDATAAEDDNLVINVASSNPKEEKLSEFQQLITRGTQYLKEQGRSVNVFKVPENISGPPKKKRKSLLGDNNLSELEAAITASKKNLSTPSEDLGKLLGAQPESGVQQVSWSQKSSWRQLVSDRGSSTFSVSHVLAGIDASTYQVQAKSASSEVPHSDSKNQDMETNGSLEGQLCEMEMAGGCVEPHPTKSNTVPNKSGKDKFSVSHVLTGIDASTDHVLPKSASLGLPHSDCKNQDFESNGSLEGQLCEIELADRGVEPQPTYSNAVSNKSGRGAFWRQQSSWTQLVNTNTDTSFSIKQIVPGLSFEEQFVPKPKGADSVSSTESRLKEIVKPDNDQLTRVGSSTLGIGKEGDVLLCGPKVGEKNCDLTPKQASARNVEVAETCSFMRSASSLKEWEKLKASLSGSLKRKNNEN